MRKGMIYALILTAALLIPSKNVELAKIKPVETVSIRYQDGFVIIETDTEDVGIGKTLEEAIEDLKTTTAGTIYMDTACFLLVGQDAEDMVSELKSYLKGNVRLCKIEEEVDIKQAGEYLRVHTPEVRLKDWQKGAKLQTLETGKERMKLA